ncbi:MAG: lysophospholipid acyltransferase family protein [Verrucomicrobiota bacterium]
MFRRYLLPWLMLGLYRAWTATWRVTLIESRTLREIQTSGGSCVFAHWHRDELAVVQYVGRMRVTTMTSNSPDGCLIDFVIRRLGGTTVKGSSESGGSGALRGLLRQMAGGRCASMAVDGPRGPIYQVKPGVFHLSKLASVPIIPVGVASRDRIVFSKSWNQARLPKPFTRVVVVFGEPFEFDVQGEINLQCPKLAARLDACITAACAEAEALGRKSLGGVRARAGGFA